MWNSSYPAYLDPNVAPFSTNKTDPPKAEMQKKEQKWYDSLSQVRELPEVIKTIATKTPNLEMMRSKNRIDDAALKHSEVEQLENKALVADAEATRFDAYKVE